jgi:hypothetical protein
MERDLVNNTTTLVAVPAQVVSGDGAIVGAIIDTLGYEAGKFSVATGAVTTGDIALTSIEESDDSGMSGSTVIPAERLIAFDTTAITTANTVAEGGFVATGRYVRLTVTGANTASFLAGATCELGAPDICSTK